MRVFSGIRPTGKLHIGNYIGAVKQWLKLQDSKECFFAIADLHGITTPYDHRNYQKMIVEKCSEYIACGIDPEKSTIFLQSSIGEHTELAYLLSTITQVSELKRMIQFKEKSKQQGNKPSAALLYYPILMASDILLYQTDIVPIGKDQLQHLELTRTIARRFNGKFGKTFKIPKALLSEKGEKIMALDNPLKKMSKSVPSSCLFLFDEPEQIRKKIMRAQTDSGKEIRYDPLKKPGISNLLTIYSSFSEKTIMEVEKEFKNKGYSELKKSLAQLLIEFLEPLRKKKMSLEKRRTYINEILNRGARHARLIASSTIIKSKERMGLL